MFSISFLDSAMGSELIRRGERLPPHIWSAHTNLHNPEEVYQVHLDNIQAGAHIITANTFRSTPRAYSKTGLSNQAAEAQAKRSHASAMHVAHKAANKTITVLGSIAPLEDCYMPELFPGEDIAFNEFSQLGNWMKEANADGIILETMNSIAEMRVALSALHPLDLPLYISFYIEDAEHLGSGERLNTLLSMLQDYSVESVLMNCAPIDILSEAVDNFVTIWPGKWGVYPNLGVGKPSPNGVIKQTVNDEELLSLMRKSVDNGAQIIGGCCGSTSRHIALMKNEFSAI